MPIIIRHNSGLNSLAEGFAAGSQGMAHGLAQRRALEQRQAEEAAQEARFQQEIGLAKDKVAREEQRRAVEDQTAQALGQAQVNQMPGAAPGGVGPEDAVMQSYRKIAEKLPAEMLPRFSQEVHRAESTRLMLDQKERHLSALQSLAKEPGAAPFMDEEMQARIQNASELLQNAQTSEELAQILPETRKAIDATREDIAARHARAGEVAQVGGYYEQQIAQDMQNAMLERNPMVRAWKLEQLDKQRKYLGAFLTARPGSVTASQFMSRMAMMDQEAPPWMQKGEEGGGRKDNKPTIQEAHSMAIAEWNALNQGKLDPETKEPIKVPLDPNWLKSRTWEITHPDEANQYDQLRAVADPMGGEGPKPGQAAPTPIPAAPKATVFRSASAENRKGFIEAAVQRLLTQGRQADIESLYDQFGIEPDSLDETALRQIQRRVKQATPEKTNSASAEQPRRKRENVGPNF